MKSLYAITLSVFLLLGQMTLIDHSEHDHSSSGNCDICITAKSLQNWVDATVSIALLPAAGFSPVTLAVETQASQTIRYYTVRAPPLFI